MNIMSSEPGQDPISLEAQFPAPPERIFSAWTDPEQVKKWFGMAPNSLIAAEIDLQVGGNWQFVKSLDEEKAISFQGQYLEIETARRLVFSWCHVVEYRDGRREQTPDSKVEVTFTPKGKGTLVTLTHSGIAAADARKGVGGGWQAAFTHLMELLD